VSAAELTITLARTDETGVAIVLRGVMDAASAPLLRTELLRLHEQGYRHVVLDLAEVSFVDSAGLGVLVVALKRFRADGGNVVVRRPHRQVARLFEMTGLDAVFGSEDGRR
jgi:anti-anti-sigma factor